MASSISAAFTKLKTDELYTPPILVEPIIKHLEYYQAINNKNIVVLCPFDKKNSEFVIAISKMEKIIVKYGHIDTGQDFFTYDYGNYDICISNPPFSLKKKIFEKLLTEKKSFALIGNLMMLNYEIIGRLFSGYNMQILSFDRRTSFDGKPSSFMSGYFCHNFLKNDLIFETLKNNNVGNNFIASKMT